jgi:hypothetical protein
MLFEVTIVIKFILFDVTPSKNKGVTSNSSSKIKCTVSQGSLNIYLHREVASIFSGETPTR